MTWTYNKICEGFYQKHVPIDLYSRMETENLMTNLKKIMAINILCSCIQFLVLILTLLALLWYTVIVHKYCKIIVKSTFSFLATSENSKVSIHNYICIHSQIHFINGKCKRVISTSSLLQLNTWIMLQFETNQPHKNESYHSWTIYNFKLGELHLH